MPSFPSLVGPAQKRKRPAARFPARAQETTCFHKIMLFSCPPWCWTHVSGPETGKVLDSFSEISEAQNCAQEQLLSIWLRGPGSSLEGAGRVSWSGMRVSQQPPGEAITKDQMARWTPRGRPAWMANDPEDQMSPPRTWHCVSLQSAPETQGKMGGEKPN